MTVADQLTARQEIKQLKYRYLRGLDGKDWDTFAATLTDDVTAAYGDELTFDGRDELVAWMRAHLTGDMITVHQVHHPEIEIHGDEATGTWALMDRVILKDRRILIEGASTYHDRYRRGVDRHWRIAHTGYRRYYESSMSLDDLPSFRLTADRFATTAAAR